MILLSTSYEDEMRREREWVRERNCFAALL